MFAGVGPFSIPAAKICRKVYANDLNPKSFYYLQQNAKLNKIQNKIDCFNMDGRQFIKHLISTGSNLPHFTQVIMNLPALAPEFLDVFKELFPSKSEFPILPTIHCYGFSNHEEPKLDMVKRIENILGTKIVPNIVHDVRDVAPKKFMICVSFKLPENIAYKHQTKEEEEGNSETTTNDSKRRKVDIE